MKQGEELFPIKLEFKNKPFHPDCEDCKAAPYCKADGNKPSSCDEVKAWIERMLKIPI